MEKSDVMKGSDVTSRKENKSPPDKPRRDETGAVFRKISRDSYLGDQEKSRLGTVDQEPAIEKTEENLALEKTEENSAVEGREEKEEKSAVYEKEENEEDALVEEHVGGCQGLAERAKTTSDRDMTITLAEQSDWDLNDSTFSETEVSLQKPPANPAVGSGPLDALPVESAAGQSEAGQTAVSVSSGGRRESGEVVSQVSSATNVTPIQSVHEEPEYEIPMSFTPRENQVTREPSRSPIYSTVIKPSRLQLSQSLSTRAGTLSPGSGVVSYASTVIIPAQHPVSDYPISKQYTLDWHPRVPKKQRCVQVSVMEEDLRTVRREMLFCDIRNISEENRGLTLVNSTGDIVFRTCYDSSLGAYGIVLDDEKTLKRSSEAMARVSRIVGCLYRLESSKTRDVWELRNPHSGKTNALIKLRKWNGFVSGCVHVTRGVEGVDNKSDIKIRRGRGSSDVVVTALLNDQIITTIRRGADRDCGIDNNIFSLFVAPYIDSVVVVSIFTALAHLQLRYERPRSNPNLVGMMIANEARRSGKSLSNNATKVKTSISKTASKTASNLSQSISAGLKEIEPHMDVFPNVKVGTFPQSTPTTPKVLSFLNKKPEKTSAEPTRSKPLSLSEFRRKYADITLNSEKKKKEKKDETSVARKMVTGAFKGTGVEIAKFGKQTGEGVKRTYRNLTKFIEKRRVETSTINAETAAH